MMLTCIFNISQAVVPLRSIIVPVPKNSAVIELVLSPLLCTLLTRDCSAKYPGNHIVAFTDDPAVAINDESMWRRDVEELVGWCDANNLWEIWGR